MLQLSGSGRPGAPRSRPRAALAPSATNFDLNVTRSAAAVERPNALPYVVYVSAAYRPDILGELCQFFSDHRVELENITCDTFQAPQTGAAAAQRHHHRDPAAGHPNPAGCATSSSTSPTPSTSMP